MFKYEYMIVFKSINAIGRTNFICKREISSYDDIEELDKLLDKKGFKNAMVLDFKLLRKFKDKEGED